MSSRQPQFLAWTATTYLLALIAFILRFAARRLKPRPLVLDDYLACAAFICATGFTAVNWAKLSLGIGKRFDDIHIPNKQDRVHHDYALTLFIDSWFYTSAISLSKCAILALYWRLFSGKPIVRTPARVAILVLSVCVLLWTTARLIVLPIQGILTPNARTGRSSPFDTNVILFATSTPHLLIEVALLLIPLLHIRKLWLPMSSKIAILLMMSSGLIVCVVAIIQIIYAYHLDTKTDEIWWECSQQLMLAVMEVNLAHFSTSLPLLGPFRDKVIRRFKGTQHKMGSPLSPPKSPLLPCNTSSHCSSQADTLPGLQCATSDIKDTKMKILVRTTTYTVVSRQSETNLRNDELAVQASSDPHGRPGDCVVGSFARASASRVSSPIGDRV
ncbi:hypothetical protein P153DRAFT_386361 [Dothidotthia symphoricarpi CBS 119687]|uniref:Rhodopsin domain-containing protein n=1 Tax=Dothidotthia symphoricarpi CBS 119687 TaxID=1392245 RepID=A0A6A6ADZ3_9PLEO|nr:uncharacterized protein P153DRAFT_386361 [Dothidotthia symphoricarpi CBS 119687]KAF2129178.1 hypothetical protein P153DRAFT_386361 [Dothidotthia symphoricarpi CBS 119687]